MAFANAFICLLSIGAVSWPLGRLPGLAVRAPIVVVTRLFRRGSCTRSGLFNYMPVTVASLS